MNSNGRPIGEQVLSALNYQKSSHPHLVLIDMILKGVPIAIYLLGFLFGRNYVLQLGLITLISAIGFYYTKNINGRVLVKLRWTKTITTEGEDEFIYECKEDESEIHAFDKKMFWMLLLIEAVFWSVMFLINILHPSNLILIIIPLSLCFINLVCFYKCSKEQQSKVNAFMAQK